MTTKLLSPRDDAKLRALGSLGILITAASILGAVHFATAAGNQWVAAVASGFAFSFGLRLAIRSVAQQVINEFVERVSDKAEREGL